MKTCKFILLVFIFFIFFSSSCEREEGQYFITIQNNSDKEIIIQGSLYSSVAQDSICFSPTGITKMEYQDFIYSSLIKPNSSRKIEIDHLVKAMEAYPNFIWSLGVFNRLDIETMSCEEFTQKFPLKHEWKVTLADMVASDWTLVYPPND